MTHQIIMTTHQIQPLKGVKQSPPIPFVDPRLVLLVANGNSDATLKSQPARVAKRRGWPIILQLMEQVLSLHHHASTTPLCSPKSSKEAIPTMHQSLPLHSHRPISIATQPKRTTTASFRRKMSSSAPNFRTCRGSCDAATMQSVLLRPEIALRCDLTRRSAAPQPRSQLLDCPPGA